MVAGLAFTDDDRLPTLKVGDTTYTNVQVLRVTATDIYFSSSSGIANAKLTSLEPAVQLRFSADATKAADTDQKQAAANAQYARALGAQEAAAPQPASDTVSTNSSATNQVLAKSFLGQKGPDLMAPTTWISNSPNTEGKFVLYDLWATTNSPSRNFISKLNDFQKDIGDRLVIIGISNESEDAVRAVVDPNIEYSSVLDPESQMQQALALKVFPYALLMDSNGIVRWEGNPLDKTNALTESTISTLLDKYGASE
jgi:hypothetical protein